MKKCGSGLCWTFSVFRLYFKWIYYDGRILWSFVFWKQKNMLLVKSASNFVPEFQTQITSAQNQYNAVNIDCKYPLTKAMNAYFWNVYRRYTINTSSCSKMIPCKWGKDKPCSGRTCSCTKAKLSCSKFYNCQKTMFFVWNVIQDSNDQTTEDE